MRDLELIADEAIELVEVLRYRARERRAMRSMETGVDTGEDCLTQQQFKAECDINTIVHRFGVSGPPVANTGGLYGDFTAITDLESAVELHDRVRAEFGALPAALREKFGNDPFALARFASSVSEDDFDEFLEGHRPAEAVEAPEAPEAAVPEASAD